MNKSDVWMPLYIGDYLADTMHLSGEEHGAYLLLLMHSWRVGPLPNDDRQLAAIARTEMNVWRRGLGEIVRKFFIAGPTGLVQPRLEHERKAAETNAERRSGKARRAAEARWKGDATSNAPSMPGALLGECPPPSPSPSSPSEKNLPLTGEANAPGSEGGAQPVPRAKSDEPLLLALAAIWNEHAANAGLPQVRDLNDKRRSHLRARIRERWTQDPERQFRAYVKRICSSDFLTGQTARGDWKADFDWAVKSDTNVLAVAEGKYHAGESD